MHPHQNQQPKQYKNGTDITQQNSKSQPSETAYKNYTAKAGPTTPNKKGGTHQTKNPRGLGVYCSENPPKPHQKIRIFTAILSALTSYPHHKPSTTTASAQPQKA
jgi:hypothetical protein